MAARKLPNGLTCNDCNVKLTWANVLRDLHAKGGYRRQCKACKNAYRRKQHPKSATSFTVDGNHACLSGLGSLDELLAKSKVDLSIWKVDRWLANSWTLANGALAVQTKAWFSRVVATPTKFPEIQPIVVNIGSPTASTLSPSARMRARRTIKTAVVLPDSQCGFSRDLRTGKLDPMHDRAALDVALQVIQEVEPDVIVLLGDMLDLTEFTKYFASKPEYQFTLQPTLAELAWWIGNMRAATQPHTEIFYLEGNHEVRLPKLVASQLMAAYDLKPNNFEQPALSVSHLLGLDKLRVKYFGDYPNGEVWLNENLRCIHGLSYKPGSVQQDLDQTRSSFIKGHCHRIEQAHRTLYHHDGPVTYCGYSPGTLARLDGHVPGTVSRQNWQNGLAVVEYEEGNGGFQVTLQPIYHGQTLFRGQQLVGKPDVKRMRKETGWETL